MAVTSITIEQSNIYNSSNLLPVHQPLSFIINCEFTGDVPDYALVKVYDDGITLLGTFRCIFESDPIPNFRRFIFYADEILKGFMGLFDDFNQGGYTLEYVEDITKEFRLVFTDSEEIQSSTLLITAIHAARQFGDYPNCSEIFNNEAKIYQAYEDKTVYVYFYNSDEGNVITITQEQVDNTAVDSDAEVFTDSDAVVFTIQTAI